MQDDELTYVHSFFYKNVVSPAQAEYSCIILEL